MTDAMNGWGAADPESEPRAWEFNPSTGASPDVDPILEELRRRLMSGAVGAMPTDPTFGEVPLHLESEPPTSVGRVEVPSYELPVPDIAEIDVSPVDLSANAAPTIPPPAVPAPVDPVDHFAPVFPVVDSPVMEPPGAESPLAEPPVVESPIAEPPAAPPAQQPAPTFGFMPGFEPTPTEAPSEATRWGAEPDGDAPALKIPGWIEPDPALIDTTVAGWRPPQITFQDAPPPTVAPTPLAPPPSAPTSSELPTGELHVHLPDEVSAAPAAAPPTPPLPPVADLGSLAEEGAFSPPVSAAFPPPEFQPAPVSGSVPVDIANMPPPIGLTPAIDVPPPTSGFPPPPTSSTPTRRLLSDPFADPEE